MVDALFSDGVVLPQRNPLYSQKRKKSRPDITGRSNVVNNLSFLTQMGILRIVGKILLGAPPQFSAEMIGKGLHRADEFL